MKRPELVAMTVWNRKTVPDAKKAFMDSRDLPVDGWGCKDVGIPEDEVKELLLLMGETGKRVTLELMKSTEEEFYQSAQLAYQCGVTAVVGGKFSKRVSDYCAEKGMEYYPFIRKNEGELDLEKMAAETAFACESGATGVCVPFYGILAEPAPLIERIKKATDKPIISASSINSRERLQEMAEFEIPYLNIGSGFFAGDFVPGGSFRENLKRCIEWMDELH